MYNTFLFNFTFKWNYHVQSCMLLTLALLVVVSTLSRGFFFVTFILNRIILSLVSARETKNMYNIFIIILLLSVILNVITMYINFILDVELS